MAVLLCRSLVVEGMLLVVFGWKWFWSCSWSLSWRSELLVVSLSRCVMLSLSLMSLILPVRMDWSLLRVTDRRNHLCVQSPASVVLSVMNVSMWFVMFVIMWLVFVMC